MTKTAAEVKFNQDKLQAAISFAREKESKNPRNLEVSHYQSFGREPFGDGIGPFAERGPATGMIIKNGYIIASWGEPDRVDKMCIRDRHQDFQSCALPTELRHLLLLKRVQI